MENKLTLQKNVIDEYLGKIKLMSNEQGRNLKPSDFAMEPAVLEEDMIPDEVPEAPPRPKAWWETQGNSTALLPLFSEMLAKLDTYGKPTFSPDQVTSIVESLATIAKAADIYIKEKTPFNSGAPFSGNNNNNKKSGWFS